MLFSCKISHSLISFLERRGEDLEAFYERCDWPSEFLRDPSSWLEADKMEGLLRQIDLEYGRGPQIEEHVITAGGHQCKDLRAWGVLDSVLRMVQTPKDLFAQPERFLSYFISPAPPLGDIHRGQTSVSFVLPVSEVQFPFVTCYLRAALEALPSYISKPMAHVTWDNSRVTIGWSDDQTSLFSETQDVDLSLRPELMRNILFNLETSQRQLDELKREIAAKDDEIAHLKLSAKSPPATEVVTRTDVSMTNTGVPNAAVASVSGHSSLTGEVSVPEGVLHELYRLGDYVARGHQLVTLLVGQGRQTRQVEEAMRRVNWEHVSTAGPQLVKWIVSELQKPSPHSPANGSSNLLSGARKPAAQTSSPSLAEAPQEAAPKSEATSPTLFDSALSL